MNPTGYRAGTRANAEGADVNRSFSRGGTTPEARAILTANRDRRFVLSLDLHEDFEADGLLRLRAAARRASTPPFRRPVVAALDDAGLPGADARREVRPGRRPGPTAARCTGSSAARSLVDYEARDAPRSTGLPSSLALMYRGTPPR